GACAATLDPSLRTSRSLICDWAFSRPRMYCATCGTSSTTRRRIWLLPAIGPECTQASCAATVRRPVRGPAAPGRVGPSRAKPRPARALRLEDLPQPFGRGHLGVHRRLDGSVHEEALEERQLGVERERQPGALGYRLEPELAGRSDRARDRLER